MRLELDQLDSINLPTLFVCLFFLLSEVDFVHRFYYASLEASKALLNRQTKLMQ